MADTRRPGSFGIGRFDAPIDDGTLVRAASPLPGATGIAAALHTGGQVVRRSTQPSGKPRVSVLQAGARGDGVDVLQHLLNLRLMPSPGLSITAILDAPTLTAVLTLQRAAGLTPNGIVGKDTWRVLHDGRIYAVAAPGVREAAGPGLARAAARAPAHAPATAPPPDVLTWPASKKFEEMVERALQKLPGSMRHELLGLITPTSIALTLAVWAAAQLTGAGEVVDIALLALGGYMLGTAIFSVMHDMGHSLILTYNASTEAELDEAAELFAHVVSVIGVTTLVALLAKVRFGRGGAATSEAASAEAAETAAARAPPRKAASSSTAGETPVAKSQPPPATPPKSTATTGKAAKTYARPSGYRKGVREKVWENAKESDGNVYDPVTRRKMDIDEPWDMGHKPGYEFRKHQASAAEREIGRKEFIDEHNDPSHYRPELPASNRSHQGEDVTDNYFGD